ncbi:MAG TPA: TIGR01906 family membrane protein [Dehalococcoidia bacterium]|nr:TIGR01906 family membrane protein [Dehalococcoidia bacterium]
MVKNRPLRFLGTLGIGLFILCIPFFLITTNLRWAVNEIRLYEYGFNKYMVSEKTGFSDEELLDVAQGLIHYFNTGNGGEEFEIFNEREVVHLEDVRSLIVLCYCVQQATLVYLIIFALAGFIWQRKRFTPPIIRMIVGGSILTIALLAFVGIAALADFDWLFTTFHHLFFSGDSWILSGYLPQIFTGGFFYDAALFIIGAIVVEALVIGGLGGFFIRRWRKTRV